MGDLKPKDKKGIGNLDDPAYRSITANVNMAPSKLTKPVPVSSGFQKLPTRTSIELFRAVTTQPSLWKKATA